MNPEPRSIDTLNAGWKAIGMMSEPLWRGDSDAIEGCVEHREIRSRQGLETEARAGRKGLWAGPQPVPPWEWRKTRKGQNARAEAR
jgi:hypothetical protein